jgi:hypothetical protein
MVLFDSTQIYMEPLGNHHPESREIEPFLNQDYFKTTKDRHLPNALVISYLIFCRLTAAISDVTA